MSEVLAPHLERFGGLAQVLAKLDERAPKAVRIEIRQPDALESVPMKLMLISARSRGRVSRVRELPLDSSSPIDSRPTRASREETSS